MKRIRYGRIAAIVTAGALALTACGNDPASDSGGDAGSDNGGEASLSGDLAGAGASSQEAAQAAWQAGFLSANEEVNVSYDPVGSGGGRTAFLEGGVAFAGSDSALKDEERTQAQERCEGGDAYELPLYISPIAIVYKVDGVDSLQLSPATVAKIFDRKITKWNDPAIVAENEGASLPDLAITPVNRSDESGTTENFTEYLHATAAADWPHEPSGDWPLQGGQSAQGTSGVVQTVGSGNGTIGYADASQAGDLGVVKVKVGESYVEANAEGAAKVVEESPRVEGLPEHALAIELKRDTTTEGSYPIVLVSYLIVCSKYSDANERDLVKGYIGYIASQEGQDAAAEAAGSAPISDALRTDVEASINSIS